MRTKHLTVLMAILIAITAFSCGKKKDKTESGVTYACPMHPEVTGEKPGTCSKCGMDLEEVK